MQRVAIVGLGLIGGSIGLGLKAWSASQGTEEKAPLYVVGFDTDLEQQSYAKKIGAVDRTEWRLPDAVANATSSSSAPRSGRSGDLPGHRPAPEVRLGGHGRRLDQGERAQWADAALPASVSFVGGHPMAGKALSIEGAEADLFKGATWCVTPSVKAAEPAVRTVLGLVAALGGEPYFVDPAEHDAYVAGVSHLPFVVSAALMNVLSRDDSWRDMKTITAGGFRDMTRLAAGSAAMHRDIVMTNRDAVLRWIDQFQVELSQLRSTVAEGDAEETEGRLTGFFEHARDARAEWATQTTREGELLQQTGQDLSTDSFGDQMGRMVMGGLFKRRVDQAERMGRKPPRR
jgi:prephenate dehydrogenase